MSATTVVLYAQDSLNNSSITIGVSPATRGGGETFTPPESAAIAQVQFRLARTSDLAGSAVVQIYRAAQVSPGQSIGDDGPIAQSDPINLASVPIIGTSPSGALIPFNFSSSTTLQQGVQYVAVLVATFTGTALTALTQFGCNTNCDPVNNGVTLVGPGGAIGSVWTSFATFDVSMIVFGLIPMGTAVLSVATVFGDGSAAAPVKVTVSNPSLGFTQTQTTAFGPSGSLLGFTVPVGSGYTITLDYTDCAGTRQVVVSPSFPVLTNTCIATGGGPFPGPGVQCQALPNFFLTKPSPSLTADIDLVKSGASPDFHHFSISRDGPVDTIFAHVGNAGNETDCFLVVFDFTFPDGSRQSFFGVTRFTNSEATATDYVKLLPGQSLDVAFPFMPTMLGRHTVSVTALWDVALPIPRLTSKTKTISFDVVP